MSISPINTPTEVNVSLEERMAAAAHSKRQATTETFPIPGWSHFVHVRLKVLGHKEQSAAVDNNRRVQPQSTMELYVAADTILAATDGFLEVKASPEGEEDLVEYETSWKQIANVVYGMAEATPRQALLRVVGGENMMIFYGRYLEWLTGERERIDYEQAADFPTTS